MNPVAKHGIVWSQGLFLDTNGDQLVGRAENGFLWLWDLTSTLGWERPFRGHPVRGSWLEHDCSRCAIHAVRSPVCLFRSLHCWHGILLRPDMLCLLYAGGTVVIRAARIGVTPVHRLAYTARRPGLRRRADSRVILLPIGFHQHAH